MFTALFCLWLVFNGRITLEIVLLGLAISVLLTFFWHKAFHISKFLILPPIPKIWKGLCYLFALIVEMISCNLHVMKLILNPHKEVHPQIIRFRSNVKSTIGRTVLANSITLTPGTITVDLNDNHFCVHALDKSFTDSLEDGNLAHRLEKMEEA